MKIQLFNPPVHHYAGVWYRMNPALGLPILAAVLKDAGHTVSVTDLEALQVSPDRLAQSFHGQQARWPDAVGFTVTQHNRRGVRECIAALRGVGFDRYIAVGGPQATLKPDDLLADGADCVVIGEAEGNVAEVFTEQPRGKWPGKALAIEQIPGPLWSVHKPLPPAYFGNLPTIGKPEGICMWSRGCPHNCTFCGNPVFGHQKIRRRPPAAIAADMKALQDLGVQSVFVYDDELVGVPNGREWLLDACDAVAPLGLVWKCQGRCTQSLRLDDLQAMYAAGCRAIMWGVESFSEPVLTAMHKQTTEADIWHTLRLANEAGIGNWLFLMVGNYGETAKDLAYTRQQVQKASDQGLVQWRQVTVTTPVPGTQLYDMARAEGWLTEPPEQGPQMNQVYESTPWLDAREIRYWKAQLEAA